MVVTTVSTWPVDGRVVASGDLKGRKMITAAAIIITSKTTRTAMTKMQTEDDLEVPLFGEMK